MCDNNEKKKTCKKQTLTEKKKCQFVVSSSPSSTPTEFRGICENLEGYSFENKGEKKGCQKFCGIMTNKNGKMKHNKKSCNKKDKKKQNRKVKVFCLQQCDKDCFTSSVPLMVLTTYYPTFTNQSLDMFAPSTTNPPTNTFASSPTDDYDYDYDNNEDNGYQR